MDGKAFDRLAKRLGASTTRRAALGSSLALVAGVVTKGRAGALPASCRHFAISGSRSIRKNFIYDDDLSISLIRRTGGRSWLLRDRDGLIGIDNESVAPIKFSARAGDFLRITARDHTATCYSLEDLFLHCCTNRQCRTSRQSVLLTRGVKEKCFDAEEWEEGTFFSELIKI